MIFHLLFSGCRTVRQLFILQRTVAALLCLWLCVLLHIPLYNVGGGEGIWLPWNIVAWSVAVTIILFVTFMTDKCVVMTPVARLLFFAALLLTLPVLWCPMPEWVIYTTPRLVGLWGAAVFYMALLQCRFTYRTKYLFFWCLTFAALVQGFTVTAGLFRPTLLSPISQAFLKARGRESLGIFQQVNVTASFLATGLALALALFYRGYRYHAARRSDLLNPLLFRIQEAYLLALMVFLPCVLVLTRSRIGWLGGITVYTVAVSTALLTSCKQSGRTRGLSWGHPAAIVFIPLTGVAVGLSLLGCSVVQAIDHGGSSYQRWITLKVTWEMIRLHPWAGWGTGSFMMQFQHYIASHYHPNPSRGFMGHPHNEVLYVWMEGGILALAGLLVAGGAVGVLFMKNGTPARRLLAMAMLPMLLHTMVEFPLYLSVPHVLILLLTGVCLDRCGTGGTPWEENPPRVIRRRAEIYLRCAVAGTCFWLLTCLHDAYRENIRFSRFETGEMPSSQTIRQTEVPWLLRSRYSVDRMNLILEDYNYSGDLRLLRNMVKDNAIWLKTHTDPDNYASQFSVLRYLHRDAEACRYQREGSQIFPLDKRFDGSICH
ncbi:membrane protein (plasmid) [Serratia marcescens]|nr:membrane protein [Serratia marcescens]